MPSSSPPKKASFIDQLKLEYVEPHPSLPPLEAPERRVTVAPKHLAGLGHAPKGLWSPKHDLPASLVVFLVALPLCLGIALASGAPPLSGLIAGIVGGVVVAALSKSPLAVSGPAAGLTVIVVNGATELGFRGFLLATVVAGVLQIIFGIAQAGVFAYYFPSAVIKGMLAAIGLILISKQLPYALGLQEKNVADLGVNTFSALPYELGNFHVGATILTALGLTIVIVMKRFPALERIKWLPAPLVVVVSGALVNALFHRVAPSLAVSGSLLVSLPADGLSGLASSMQFPDFSRIGDAAIYSTGFTIAAVASVETLLCIEAIDKLDPFKRATPTNRELVAQGAGNMLSGLLGGLPVTAVIVRGSANVQSGARTRGSSFFHGIWLLLAVVAIPFVMNLIPLASLSAVLLHVGYKLTPYRLFINMFKKRPLELWLPFILTVVVIVTTDMLKGVGAGMLVALFFVLRDNLRTPYFIHHQEQHAVFRKQFIKIQLSENVSFLNKASVNRVLHELPEESLVEIDGAATEYLHPDVLELIYDFADTAHTRDIEVLLTSLPEHEPSDAMH